MNEGSGNKVYDLSGNGNHATIYGATWTRLASGKNALHFDGVNQYASVPSFTFPQVFTVVLSVKAYPKHSVHNSHEVAFGHPYLWDGTASLTLEDVLFGVFRVFDAAGTEYPIGYDHLYDEGVFTHVVAQYDGARMRLYKNGELVGERSAPSTLRYPANELRLFMHGGGDQHNNMVASSFLIYSRALSDAEIRTLYELHRGLFVG
ncbi:MAG: LamG-like jellyroll fold domain-containing protein [Desulfurococcaceae archaeon]